jgi:Phytanoyl-CoA dioxygenase (PhyH)
MALTGQRPPAATSAAALPAQDFGLADVVVALTEQQCAFFHREGYLVLPAVTTASEVERLRTIYEHLFEQRTGWKDGNYLDFAGPDGGGAYLPQILMPSFYEPALRQTRLFSNCLGIARQLLGPSAELVFDHAMTKPARGGLPTPWHQDKAFYTTQTTHEAITFWVPLQPVARESGCLRFIPRSNQGPIHSHRHLNNDPHVHGLEVLNVDEKEAVSCPLPAGGATIHHHRTLHGAEANVAGEHRWAYAMGFGIKSAVPTVTREYAWNRSVLTDRELRYVSSLNRWGRVKYRLRSKLVYWGFW